MGTVVSGWDRARRCCCCGMTPEIEVGSGIGGDLGVVSGVPGRGEVRWTNVIDRENVCGGRRRKRVMRWN